MNTDRLQCVALYARYSSDAQREASIEDQLRICRARVVAGGMAHPREFTDAAFRRDQLAARISGAPAALRDGVFESYLAESLDRFSRDQEHIAAFYKQVTFAGVRIVTLAEGEVSELHIGLKGTMGALYSRTSPIKQGVASRGEYGKEGLSGCILRLQVVRVLGANGEPRPREAGNRPREAAVVRRIFQNMRPATARWRFLVPEPRRIPGPGGRLWYNPSIRGRSGRGDGILRNEVYIGRLIWNRGATSRIPERKDRP